MYSSWGLDPLCPTLEAFGHSMQIPILYSGSASVQSHPFAEPSEQCRHTSILDVQEIVLERNGHHDMTLPYTSNTVSPQVNMVL